MKYDMHTFSSAASYIVFTFINPVSGCVAFINPLFHMLLRCIRLLVWRALLAQSVASSCLGQARSWDMPFKMLGTCPLLGQALQNVWGTPALGTGSSFSGFCSRGPAQACVRNQISFSRMEETDPTAQILDRKRKNCLCRYFLCEVCMIKFGAWVLHASRCVPVLELSIWIHAWCV